VLEVMRTTRRLVFTRHGPLLPWMGPALRGLLGWRLKTVFCRQPREEWNGRWRYCAGCPHMAECAYGQTLEPDPPLEAEVFRGQEQAARPMVLCLPFPMPLEARPGLKVPVTLTLVGRLAIAQADHIWRSLNEAGTESGFDPDHTTFVIEPDGEMVERAMVELPLALDGESLPWLRVELDAPLLLRSMDETGRRRHIADPSFADLLRASLRTLGGLFALYDAPLAANFAHLKDAAADVPLVESGFESFYQRRWSNRARQARPVHGVVGWGVYGPLPAALMRWLVWGGQLHVGLDRVAGAGGWEVTVP
jgi:hypothetical protein